MMTKKLIGCHGEIHIFIVRPTKIEHSALGVKADHSMFSFKLLLWPLEIHVEAESMVISHVRKQDIKANRIRDNKLIVDHSLRCVQQNLPFSEFELKLLVNDDFVALREEVDDTRILVFIESPKLR